MNDLDWPDRTATPLLLHWPAKGNPVAVHEFRKASDWQAFIRGRDLDLAIPEIVRFKYQRAQRLYAIAWYEFDIIKAGELVALTALELALRDCYGNCLRKPNGKLPMLHELLRYMVEKDSLTNDVLPFAQECGGTVLPLLYGPARSGDAQKLLARTTLASIRNSMAHGDPFDGLPWSGLLDLVRDLIHYAYRGMISESAAIRIAAT